MLYKSRCKFFSQDTLQRNAQIDILNASYSKKIFACNTFNCYLCTFAADLLHPQSQKIERITYIYIRMQLYACRFYRKGSSRPTDSQLPMTQK